MRAFATCLEQRSSALEVSVAQPGFAEPQRGIGSRPIPRRPRAPTRVPAERARSASAVIVDHAARGQRRDERWRLLRRAASSTARSASFAPSSKPNPRRRASTRAGSAPVRGRSCPLRARRPRAGARHRQCSRGRVAIAASGHGRGRRPRSHSRAGRRVRAPPRRVRPRRAGPDGSQRSGTSRRRAHAEAGRRRRAASAEGREGRARRPPRARHERPPAPRPHRGLPRRPDQAQRRQARGGDRVPRRRRRSRLPGVE